MRKPLATSVLAVIAVVVTAVALTAVDASFASNGPRAALDTELRAVPTSDSASPAGRRAAPQALDFDVATNDARRTTRRAARTALALTVQDEEGRTVRGLELQRRAADAPE